VRVAQDGKSVEVPDASGALRAVHVRYKKKSSAMDARIFCEWLDMLSAGPLANGGGVVVVDESPAHCAQVVLLHAQRLNISIVVVPPKLTGRVQFSDVVLHHPLHSHYDKLLAAVRLQGDGLDHRSTAEWEALVTQLLVSAWYDKLSFDMLRALHSCGIVIPLPANPTADDASLLEMDVDFGLGARVRLSEALALEPTREWSLENVIPRISAKRSKAQKEAAARKKAAAAKRKSEDSADFGAAKASPRKKQKGDKHPSALAQEAASIANAAFEQSLRYWNAYTAAYAASAQFFNAPSNANATINPTGMASAAAAAAASAAASSASSPTAQKAPAPAVAGSSSDSTRRGRSRSKPKAAVATAAAAKPEMPAVLPTAASNASGRTSSRTRHPQQQPYNPFGADFAVGGFSSASAMQAHARHGKATTSDDEMDEEKDDMVDE
jgi:hypothetical protein